MLVDIQTNAVPSAAVHAYIHFLLCPFLISCSHTHFHSSFSFLYFSSLSPSSFISSFPFCASVFCPFFLFLQLLSFNFLCYTFFFWFVFLSFLLFLFTSTYFYFLLPLLSSSCFSSFLLSSSFNLNCSSFLSSPLSSFSSPLSSPLINTFDFLLSSITSGREMDGNILMFFFIFLRVISILQLSWSRFIFHIHKLYNHTQTQRHHSTT